MFGVACLHDGVDLRVEGGVVRRQAEIWRALEDGQLRRLRRHDRNRLDGRRAGANDSDPLAAEVDPFVRPVAGVIPGALEAVEALDFRLLRDRQAAGGHDHESGPHAIAAVGGNRPRPRRLVVAGALHPGLEVDVTPQVEAVSDVAGVLQDFGLRGVALAPCPLLLQLFRKRIRILQAFDVAAGSRISIPPPGAADVRRGIEHSG